MNVVELLFQPLKITDAIPVTIVESAYVDLIDDRVLVPKHIPIQWQTASSWTNFSTSLQETGRYASLYEVTSLGSYGASNARSVIRLPLRHMQQLFMVLP